MTKTTLKVPTTVIAIHILFSLLLGPSTSVNLISHLTALLLLLFSSKWQTCHSTVRRARNAWMTVICDNAKCGSVDLPQYKRVNATNCLARVASYF